MRKPYRFATHSKKVQEIAVENGWLPSARYTNLRDVASFDKVHFIDIDFKNYSFNKHLEAVQECRPHLTVARDVFKLKDLNKILLQAEKLSKYSDKVIIVPKDENFKGVIDKVNLCLGYRLQLKSIVWPKQVKLGEPFDITHEWANAGVAPCYPGGHPCITLKDKKEALKWF